MKAGYRNGNLRDRFSPKGQLNSREFGSINVFELHHLKQTVDGCGWPRTHDGTRYDPEDILEIINGYDCMSIWAALAGSAE